MTPEWFDNALKALEDPAYDPAGEAVDQIIADATPLTSDQQEGLRRLIEGGEA